MFTTSVNAFQERPHGTVCVGAGFLQGWSASRAADLMKPKAPARGAARPGIISGEHSPWRQGPLSADTSVELEAHGVRLSGPTVTFFDWFCGESRGASASGTMRSRMRSPFGRRCGLRSALNRSRGRSTGASVLDFTISPDGRYVSYTQHD